MTAPLPSGRTLRNSTRVITKRDFLALSATSKWADGFAGAISMKGTSVAKSEPLATGTSLLPSIYPVTPIADGCPREGDRRRIGGVCGGHNRKQGTVR